MDTKAEAAASNPGMSTSIDRTTPEKVSTYVVMRAVRPELATGHASEGHPSGFVLTPTPQSTGVWEEIAIVKVPIRSQRKTAVIQALEEIGVTEGDCPLMLRALDEDAVELIPAVWEQPAAPAGRLKVG